MRNLSRPIAGCGIFLRGNSQNTRSLTHSSAYRRVRRCALLLPHFYALLCQPSGECGSSDEDESAFDEIGLCYCWHLIVERHRRCVTFPLLLVSTENSRPDIGLRRDVGRNASRCIPTSLESDRPLAITADDDDEDATERDTFHSILYCSR